MPYSDQTHIDRTLYRARISGWIYFFPSISIIFGLIFIVGSYSYSLILANIGVILLIVGLFFLIKRFLYVRFTELYITQKFTIAKYGIIKRDTIEMLNNKVESIRVNQGIIGRVLNYGDIVIVGAGGSSSPIRFISTPLEFRRQLVYVQDEASKGK